MNLFERSGEFKSDDPLVSVLYELMRDHVTPGILEKLVWEAESCAPVKFTNGWLAQYAQDLAIRLQKK